MTANTEWTERTDELSDVDTDLTSKGGGFREGVYSFALLPLDATKLPKRRVWPRVGSLGVTGLLGIGGRRASASEAADSRAVSFNARAISNVRLALLIAVLVALLAGGGSQLVGGHLGEGPEFALASRSAGSDGGGGGRSGGGGLEGGGGSGPTSTSSTTTSTSSTTTSTSSTTTSTSSTTTSTSTTSSNSTTSTTLPAPLLLQADVAVPGVGAVGIGIGHGNCTGARVLEFSTGCPKDGRDATGLTVDITGNVLPPQRIVIP